MLFQRKLSSDKYLTHSYIRVPPEIGVWIYDTSDNNRLKVWADKQKIHTLVPSLIKGLYLMVWV